MSCELIKIQDQKKFGLLDKQNPDREVNERELSGFFEAELNSS